MTDRLQHARQQLATSFGFQKVRPEDKAALVGSVFERVAGRYDLMNDLMSGGIHRLWKSAMIDWLAPRPGLRLLDVAGGTGDIAFRVLDRLERKAGPAAQITICDINPAMVEVGRDRAIDQNRIAPIHWLCGDAEALPSILRKSHPLLRPKVTFKSLVEAAGSEDDLPTPWSIKK